MIMLPVGYLSGETSTYHYYIKDYLGNNRIVADAHGNVEEVNHYYPYGALMGDSRNTGLQPYKYIGKELDRTHGLDWYDHGARHYDPVTGRWNTMDKMCEKYYDVSPYASCGDDPVNAVDPDGKQVRPQGKEKIAMILSTLQEEYRNFVSIDEMTTGETGLLGKTLFPDNDGVQNSTSNNVEVYINLGLSPNGRAEAYSHEVNGHVLLYFRSGYNHKMASHSYIRAIDTNTTLRNLIMKSKIETIKNNR